MGSTQQAEVERKYEVDESAVLPGLADGTLVRAVREPADLVLEAVYFDTPERVLFQHGASLRRRTGGEDAGWHLKVPAGPDSKTEYHHPLGRSRTTVPKALLDHVRALVRDHPVAPVASITTRRLQHALVGEGEEVLALVCDDHVTGHALPGGPEGLAWREWEVELAAGSPDLLDPVEARLIGAGAQRASRSSKLTRVLGERVTPSADGGGDAGERGPGAAAAGHRGPAPGSAGALLQDYLATQVASLHAEDAFFREQAPGGVHGMRIAARRMRSALATCRPVLAPDAAEDLRGELRWLGQELGPARDVQVQGKRLRDALAAEPAELVLGPVLARVDRELGKEAAESLGKAREVLGSARYFRLLDALDDLVARPPLDPSAGEGADRVFAALLARDVKRLRRRVAAASQATDAARDAALHEARKKAKRLRYAAEVATPALGRPAKRLAKRVKALQQALGEHQDSVVARERLRVLGVQAHLSGENGFTFGLLHGLERARAQRAEEEFRRAWKRVPTRRVAAWLAS